MASRSTEFVKRVGRRLRELRENTGQTQEQVAERAGFTSKYLSEIERGLRDPPITTLDRLATRGLGCTVCDLFPPATKSAVRSTKASTNRLPLAVRRMAQDVAGLPPETRRGVLGVIRAALALTRKA